MRSVVDASRSLACAVVLQQCVGPASHCWPAPPDPDPESPRRKLALSRFKLVWAGCGAGPALARSAAKRMQRKARANCMVRDVERAVGCLVLVNEGGCLAGLKVGTRGGLVTTGEPGRSLRAIYRLHYTLSGAPPHAAQSKSDCHTGRPIRHIRM